jgi:hypothetical protein
MPKCLDDHTNSDDFWNLDLADHDYFSYSEVTLFGVSTINARTSRDNHHVY